MTESSNDRTIDVLKVAALARLTITAEEAARFEPQLRAILGHIAQLDAVDTASVEATSHVLGIDARLREDDVVQGLRREEALSQAPRTAEGAFVVPRFVES